MFKFVRPEKPDDFQIKANVETAKLETQIAEQPDKLIFNNKFWGNYKSHFKKTQNNKCGYCELRMSSYGDVEHYKPKSVVEGLDQQGYELEDLMNVKGRTFLKSCKYGYWWLAYDWDNYLLSCTLCNQPWKRALFPIEGGRLPNSDTGSPFPHKSPEKDDIEVPLLLNPFDTEDLSMHISYSELGLIKPHNNSERGRQTIITCGLDRPSLFEAKASTAIRMKKLMKKLSDAEVGSEGEKWLAEMLLDMGDENSDFSGMVRIMFTRYSGGRTWAEFEGYMSPG
jgi:hypothetical protein